MKVYRQLILLGAMAMVPACSGGKDKEAEEPVANEAAGDEAAAEAPAKEAPAEAAAAEAAAPAPAPAPAPAKEAAPAAAAPAAAPAAAEPAGFTGAKVTKYVNTVALKVHPTPDKTSAVLGWVKRGDKVDVVVNGDWAKLDTGKYISNKFLVDNPVSADAPAKKKKGK